MSSVSLDGSSRSRTGRETGSAQGRSPRERAPATGRGTHRMKSAAPSARDSSFGAAAPASPFSVTLPGPPGPRSRRSGVGGPRCLGVRPGPVAQIARCRPISAVAFRTPPVASKLGRAAVTGASDRASAEAPGPTGFTGATASPSSLAPVHAAMRRATSAVGLMPWPGSKESHRKGAPHGEQGFGKWRCREAGG